MKWGFDRARVDDFYPIQNLEGVGSRAADLAPLEGWAFVVQRAIR